MALQINFSEENMQKLAVFIEQNKTTDFKLADLSKNETIENFQWTGLENDKDELVPLILAYQRVLRFLPENKEAVAMTLLRNEIHSALQIVAVSRKVFMNSCLELFNGDTALAETVYQNACDIRSGLLVKYIDGFQKQEPHISAARFN